jgi:hypothetical protein
MLRTWTIDKTFRFMLHTWNPLFGTLNSIIGTLDGIIGTLNGIIGALIRTVLGNGGLSHHYLYEAAIAAAANSRCNQRREIPRGHAPVRECMRATRPAVPSMLEANRRRERRREGLVSVCVCMRGGRGGEDEAADPSSFAL